MRPSSFLSGSKALAGTVIIAGLELNCSTAIALPLYTTRSAFILPPLMYILFESATQPALSFPPNLADSSFPFLFEPIRMVSDFNSSIIFARISAYSSALKKSCEVSATNT